MRYLRESRGFTLIELAIVLIIIGIILGAVLKGQDLIENARIKQFITKVRAWEIAQWNYYDRKGRFAGDTNNDGIIGDGNVKTELEGANFIEPPWEISGNTNSNTITIGSQRFYVFFGNDNGTKNIMVLCKDTSCGNFDNEHLPYLESLDAVIDGVSNGSGGRFVGSNAAPNLDNSGNWTANFQSTFTPANWTNSTRAAVYYFDSKR